MNAGEVASVSFTNEGMVTFYLDDRPQYPLKRQNLPKVFHQFGLEKTHRVRV